MKKNAFVIIGVAYLIGLLVICLAFGNKYDGSDCEYNNLAKIKPSAAMVTACR